MTSSGQFDQRGDRSEVSFVIPVRNDASRLAHCLDSIRASRYPPALIDIIVVDNGSTDGSADVARSRNARVLSLPRMRLGALRNTGAGAARGAVLAFVDADHEIVPDWIDVAIDGLADGRVGAIGAACRPPQPGTWVQRTYDWLRPHPGRRQPVDWLGSGNMAVRQSAFDAVGGFDTSLETCEDVDLCRKLSGRGFVLLGDDRLHNVHYGDPETLRHVFFGELWRGRDNLRVSLRPPRQWRTLASALIPILNLLALATILIGVLTGSPRGWAVAAAAAIGVGLLIGLRALKMVLGRGSAVALVPAVAVAAAYELGRASAVAARVRYGRRREGSTS